MAMSMWMILGITFVAGWFFLPILGAFVGPLLPAKYRKPLGAIWVKLAMLTYDRAMLVMRRDGSYDLLPSSYDAEAEAEAVDIGGETRHFADSHGLMGSLARRKLGIAIEEVSAVLNPAIVAVGAAQDEKLADGSGYVNALKPGSYSESIEGLEEWLAETPASHVVELVDQHGSITEAYWDTDVSVDEDGGDRGQWVAAMNPFTKLRDRDTVVDMREVWNILEGTSDSDIAQRVQDRTLASQAKRGDSSAVIRYLIPGAALLIGWVLRDLSAGGGGGGGSVVPVPYTIAPFIPTPTAIPWELLVGVIG